jgi:methylated-DNA-[protein]-cysteine S-methyltransferase
MSEQGNTRSPAPQPPLDSLGFAVFEHSPVGPLWIAWVEDGITMLYFGSEAPPAAEQERWLPEVAPIPEAPLPAVIADVLSRYFAGEPIDPTILPVRLRGTRFQRRAWEALRRIPRGQVRTYAGLANDVGSPRATRAIGTAMARNPIAIVVPCHRAVAVGFALGGFSGGIERKRALLELEGVKIEGERVLPGQLDLL